MNHMASPARVLVVGWSVPVREDNMKLSKKWGLSLVAGVVAMLAVTGTALASQFHQGYGGTEYYLSLGDSLSVGFQPDSAGVGHPTDRGFDHVLLAELRQSRQFAGKDLRLTELGCASESSTTMINGGVCQYPNAKSQLDAATRFLATHRGRVPFVTIDIGANDVQSCASTNNIDVECVQQGLSSLQTNLKTIVAAIKHADPGAATKFVGLNEYDPFLAAFLQGPTGQQLATQSVDLVTQLNQVITKIYADAGIPVADVADAFKTAEFTPLVSLPNVGEVPQNVADICQLTFMCTPAPVGPNIHPNDTGYQVMEKAVAAKL